LHKKGIAQRSLLVIAFDNIKRAHFIFCIALLPFTTAYLYFQGVFIVNKLLVAYNIAVIYMSPCELTATATAIANTIACNIPDDDQLNLLGTVLTLIGDTLVTIVAQRIICERNSAENV